MKTSFSATSVLPNLQLPTNALSQNVVLVGLESVGKTALFRHLTGEAAGDETNVRGSTVTVRSATLPARMGRVFDVPGIRLLDDSATTRLALRQLKEADTAVLVVRGTDARYEIETLLAELTSALVGRNVALVITFADKAAVEITQLAAYYRSLLSIPVVLVNGREMNVQQRAELLRAIDGAAPLQRKHEIALLPAALPDVRVIAPHPTLFERRSIGPWLSLATIFLLFGLPVYFAYLFADWAQPFVDDVVIMPLVTWLTPLAEELPLLHAILAGDYGLLTLGWYSFLWAFPVVLLIGVSVAITEESGLKDRITAALDPWLRRIGLNGRDLVPILSGFGCNVVAVFQSRACSRCTRSACLSMITFGSACSYQIGASLSIFGSAQAPWLFMPYLFTLFFVGAIYTRLGHRPLAEDAALPIVERAFLQAPTWRGVQWRVKAVLKQFLQQAMPIFLLICMVGALLEYTGVLTWLAQGISPVLRIWGLPSEVAPGLIFAIIRKDGLLVLNQGQGALLQTLTLAQVFILVYLASTLTACLATLWTIRRELGWRFATLVASKQAATSVISALVLATLLRWLF